MNNLILDYDLSLLKELIRTIDQQLDQISEKSMQVDDADSFGYFDSAEHFTGLGFVACQTYLTAVYGCLKIEKQHALSMGPLHSSGQTKVQIINHAANYWKHNNEWSLDRNSAQRKIIENTFESIGFPINIEYPLSGVLTEVASPEPAAFEPVIALLEVWTNVLYKAA
jgi:hypothetical protein